MKRTFFVIVIAIVAAVGAAAADHDHAPAVSDDARFEFLKQLSGTWVGEGLNDKPGGIYEFAVTAGGTAVREIEMVGTPMEMVTLYYMEGQNLVATHYCMLGNQPRLEARKPAADGTVAFACTGTPGNAKSHDEHHVHGWAMRLNPDGSLRYSAELVENGKVTHAPDLVLTRQQRSASN